MGPIRNKNNRVNYDPELPESWTLARLREALRSKNISFPSNLRRMGLVRLYRQSITQQIVNTIDETSTAHAVTSARSQDAPLHANNNNNNGRDHRDKAFTEIISSLTNTVKSLQENVTTLTNKVNNLSSNNVTNSQQSRVDDIPVPTVTSVSNSDDQGYTLDSAMRAFRTPFPTAAAGSEEQARANITSRGYAAESLPFVETISPQLRRNIITGRDINLATLLIPYYSGSGVHDSWENEKGGNYKPDHRVNRNLDLGDFIQAFTIYKNVMCSAFPNRRAELDVYERDVVNMATQYPGPYFYEYHKQFAREAAAHLRFNNKLIDWSIRNNTLFCNIFANAKPKTCSVCGSCFHSTVYCNLNYKFPNRSKLDEVDTYGRERINHLGREICNNYNGIKGCVAPRCRFLHICLTCKGDHSRVKCSSVSKNEPTGSQKMGAPFTRKL